MAFYTETLDQAAPRATWGVGAWFARVGREMVRRRQIRVTYAALSMLGDSELASMGLHRSEIRRAAREAADKIG